MSTKHQLATECASTGWKFFVFVRQMFAKECNVATTACLSDAGGKRL